MVQLNILSGKKAGSQPVVRHFPFRLGRASANDLQIDDDGVWDQHLTLELRRDNSLFAITVAPDALATINSQPVQTALLRNGDIITFGSVKIQFQLAAAQQRGLRVRESCVWVLIIAVTVAQLAFVYWLVR